MYPYKLLKDAFESLKLSLAGITANAIVVYIIFYGQVANTVLTSWFAFVIVISLLRLGLLILFNKHPLMFDNKIWANLFTLGVVFSGLSWGVTPILFFLPGEYIYQMVLIIVLAGMSAGALSSISHMYRNIVLFSLLLQIPLILVLIMQDSQVYFFLSFLVFFYLLLTLNVSKKFNINYITALESRELYEKKREELLRSEQKFESIFKNVPIGVFFYDTTLVIQEANEEFARFLQAPREFLVGLNMKKLKDRRILPALEAPLQGIEGFYEGEYLTTYSTIDIWISMTTSPLKNHAGEIIGGIGIVSNITQRILSQQHIEHQANFDTLTDIPNRISIFKEIQKELIRYQRHKQIFGLLFLDLDNFKNINDSLGHAVGDDLLVQMAQRLTTSIRVEDTVARIGGDEFVVLVPDLGDEEKSAATKIEHVAHKIHEALSNAFLVKGYSLTISSSIGIILVNDETQNADDLLKHADIAMYQAKKEGKNTSRFYKEEMDLWIKRRLEIENELRHAVKNNELKLHYQPIVEFSTSSIIGAEALLRWKNPNLGEIFPDEFIPVAEESGLILSIGEWVLEHAILQFLEWKNNFEHIKSFKKIAVNVSAHQFNNEGFIKSVEDIIHRTDIEPHFLELELTESIIVKDIQQVRRKMQALRHIGVSLSIDDFGTGYSSLSYLKKLPFTTLKIDKSFTQDIQDDADDKELISTIITIAKNFNLEVIIEGVETHEQYLFAHEKNAKYLQGYYCSKPLDANSFTQILSQTNGVCDKLG